MRPKSLEIEGLQSFRDKQKIDFDALGETGLFGIFGPTGSGKSTILDGITFALYGRVKRAERGTQGIINANFKMAKVTFTFELLKEGIRKTYRVERTYQRKKGSENSCEPKVARLLEITGVGDIPICDKASEVTAGIEELIGLSHDDFTRAVVLPQTFSGVSFLVNAKKKRNAERYFISGIGKSFPISLTK
jgi:exonuclease SbcC